MQTIAERLQLARNAIKMAAADAQRDSNSVQLLAVSKTKSVSEITQAYEVGQRLFGENYVQEGVAKVQEMAEFSDIEWHMIGPIQSNKTKVVAEHFSWVQSVDRIKIARRLNDQRPPNQGKLNICIQVNIDNEDSKAGIGLDDLADFVQDIRTLPNLQLRGLMAIPKANNEKAKQIQSYTRLHNAFLEYHKLYAEFDTLSLGMSGDLDTAIHMGSTMVRIGTAIFGARQTKQHHD